MKHSTFVKSIALLALACAGTTTYAHTDIPLRKIKAVKSATQVNLLDSVISDSYRKIYKYNEYGYITSVMAYRKDSKWTIDTSTSYIQDYVFDANGQCTSRITYNVDEQGNRSTIEDKGELVVKDGLTWENIYERFNDGKLHPSTSKAYDKWGNLSIEIVYETDWYSYEDYISSYTEKRYSGSIHSGHRKQSSFESAYCTYSVEAKSGERTMDPSKLNLSFGSTDSWEILDGKLYFKSYMTMNLDSEATVGNLDKYLTLTREDVYELNADGTRPVSMTSTFSRGESYESMDWYTYTWDDKGRLLSESHRGASNNLSYKQSYSYADDYAKELSLMDAVYALKYELTEYPEDKYCQFGHMASHVIENNGSNYEDHDQTSYLWDENGHLVYAKWCEWGTESWYDYGSEKQDSKEYNYSGYEYFFYNSDGHMSYMTGLDYDYEDGNEYYKLEYIYNEKGVWTDKKDYYGESIDGPWTSEDGSNKVRARRTAHKSAPVIDDMSDGYHDINYNDGVFLSQGSYQVEDGKIVFGYCHQYIPSSASIPHNPELNYTDPAVPLDTTDDCDYAAECFMVWNYQWDTSSESWELMFGPEFATHIYKNGNDIVCDTYNKEQVKTATTTYSIDEEERLIKQSGSDCEITYEYLDDGSDYLLETVTTIGGNRSVQHYYYSLHDYTPTGIKNVNSATTGNDTYYDLQGRRISNPTAHGIYIVRGKKVVK